jgi:dTDP-4-amino-4,6-dideoxygalactose transaminase
MQAMLDQGIATRRGVMCSHLEPPYREASEGVHLAHSEQAQRGAIVLPLYVQMTSSDIERVARALREACWQ